MLEAMVTLVLVVVGVVLIIAILGYGIYITIYPLIKTVQGGVDAMKEHAGGKKRVPTETDARPLSSRIGRVRKKGRRPGAGKGT